MRQTPGELDRLLWSMAEDITELKSKVKKLQTRLDELEEREDEQS